MREVRLFQRCAHSYQGIILVDENFPVTHEFAEKAFDDFFATFIISS